jgi:hypothetical protein
MKSQPPFQTARLDGRAPSPADAAIYARLFGAAGARELERNLQDFERHQIAPWTLAAEGRDVGVGGFRLGFGQQEGLELCLTLVPDRLPIGLAAEFLSDALLCADGRLRADRLFALTDEQATLSRRMLEGRGFEDAGAFPRPGRPNLHLMRRLSPS